jgi:hypothetical protein
MKQLKTLWIMAISKAILVFSIFLVSCTPKFRESYNKFMREVDQTNCGRPKTKYQNHKLDSTKLSFVPIYMTKSLAPANRNKKNEKLYLFYLPNYDNQIYNQIGLYQLENYLTKPSDFEDYEEFNGTIRIKRFYSVNNYELIIKNGHFTDKITHNHLFKRKKCVVDYSFLFQSPPNWPRYTYIDIFGNERCTSSVLFDVPELYLILRPYQD